MSGVLLGKRALITGGGRGIGAAIGRRFAEEGAELVIAARTQAELEAVAAGIRMTGARVTVRTVDVSDRAQAESLVKGAEEQMGGLDVLVNAAGVYGPIGALVDNDLDEWERALQINLLGTLYTCRAAASLMLNAGGGSIVNLSGGGATQPLPRFSSYAVTKAAVVRLTDTLAAELESAGVRVNAIAPGAVDTRLQDAVLAAGERAGELYARMDEMRRTGKGATPPEVPAELAVFLASDASKGLTGKLISAPHDPWRDWDAERIRAIATTAWYTIRRLDPFTISKLGPTTP